MKLSKNNYYQEKISKLSFTNKVIKGKEFEECRFNGCIFIDCTFDQCKFINCKFTDCILSAINPRNSHFIEVKFIKSKVMGLDWVKAARVRDLDFESCHTSDSNFRLLKLPELKMVNCVAKDVDFTGADLSRSEFNGTDFEKSIFFKTNLSKANFKGAKNYLIDARHNTLNKTKFSLPEALSLLSGLDIILD